MNVEAKLVTFREGKGDDSGVVHLPSDSFEILFRDEEREGHHKVIVRTDKGQFVLYEPARAE